MKRVFFAGHPSELGGAGTECLALTQLFQRNGVEVHFIPTWSAPDSADAALTTEWTVHRVSPRSLGSVPGLAGSPVIAMANKNANVHAHRFRELGCRFFTMPCMCYLRPGDKSPLKHGSDVYAGVVCQSEWQRSRVEPVYRKHGYTGEFHLIRGAFSWWLPEWSFRPCERKEGEPFVVGKIARPHLAKWNRDLWKIYGRIPNVRATVLGFDEKVARHIGRCPKWCRGWKPRERVSWRLMEEMHCMCPPNDTDEENWPRVGLEAMAKGVVLVVERKFGWTEMVDHGRTGLLADSLDDLSVQCCRLEADEALRIELASNARKSLETELAEPDTIWRAWRKLLWGEE